MRLAEYISSGGLLNPTLRTLNRVLGLRLLDHLVSEGGTVIVSKEKGRPSQTAGLRYWSKALLGKGFDLTTQHGY